MNACPPNPWPVVIEHLAGGALLGAMGIAFIALLAYLARHT